ncbi:hypothetical protein SNE32_13220, partial [Lysobacter sp. D1-1-M9]
MPKQTPLPFPGASAGDPPGDVEAGAAPASPPSTADHGPKDPAAPAALTAAGPRLPSDAGRDQDLPEESASSAATDPAPDGPVRPRVIDPAAPPSPGHPTQDELPIATAATPPPRPAPAHARP